MSASLRRSLSYGQQIGRGLVRHSIRPSDLVTSFPEWWASVSTPGSPMEDRRPWMTFAAIRELEGALAPGARVFEYGVGGSTLFFLDRGATVVSVEHDQEWAARTREALGERTDWELHVCPPDPGAPDDDDYASPDMTGSFRDYVTAIDGQGEFDVVVVDGRARNACLRSAPEHVRAGGLLVLDNAERGLYRPGADAVDRLGWQRNDYFGPGPYNLYFWQTTTWRAPAASPR